MPIESFQYFIILFRVNQVFTFYHFIVHVDGEIHTLRSKIKIHTQLGSGSTPSTVAPSGMKDTQFHNSHTRVNLFMDQATVVIILSFSWSFERFPE